MTTWTPARLKAAEKMLSEYPYGSLPIVCARLTSQFGMKVTVNGIDAAFKRAGLKTPMSFMADAEIEPVDHVAAKEKKDRQRVLLSTNKDLIDQLKIEREKVALLNKLQAPYKPLKIVRHEFKSGLREMTALVGASDWHVEEEVNPIKVHGKNKFTLDIADLRVKRFFNGVVDLVQHHRASKKILIRDMVLWLGGDLITGHIHEEMLMTSQLSPIATVLWLAPRLKAGINFLLDELDLTSLVIPCDIGNHGRTTKFRNITTGPETSFEWGLYCQLAREFANDKRVRFDTSPSNDHYVDIYDFRLHTTHGDSVRYGGGVGGLTIPLLKAISAWDTDVSADWHMIGHFHTALTVDKAIANGSLIGWGAYSKWIKCRYNPRDLSQHFSLIDRENGQCHPTPIWVSNMREEKRFWTKGELALCS